MAPSSQNLAPLQSALPAGTPAEQIEALLGEPNGRIDLSGDGPAVTTWTYRAALIPSAGHSIPLAVDLDAKDRLVAIRRLRPF
ncbi:hypothetical protein HCU64_19955 [Methylobacterium sp. C25]|uniref:hypothetical protein n=1 Tax=Methylobacterium sp. C25 TaxID=2721622 RepID=UPI001F45D840|nr:hypothetical protein [Methylobacterium sp. C25]MCE4226029.1 hypothetical protein [Methylobacterium sp. C25]